MNRDELLKRFIPLTLDEQKDVLFLIASEMDRCQERIGELSKKRFLWPWERKDAVRLSETLDKLKSIADCFCEPTREFMKAGATASFSLKYAGHIRREYEGGKR